MDHVTRPRSFLGWSVIRRLTLDIVCQHTKFDGSSLSHSRDISEGVKF